MWCGRQLVAFLPAVNRQGPTKRTNLVLGTHNNPVPGAMKSTRSSSMDD